MAGEKELLVECGQFNMFMANAAFSQHRWLVQHPSSPSHWWPLTICVYKCLHQGLEGRRAEKMGSVSWAECYVLVKWLELLVGTWGASRGWTPLGCPAEPRMLTMRRETSWYNAKSLVWNLLYWVEIPLACALSKLLIFSELQIPYI